ncbi:MAG: hypothetical protein IT580_24075 [Verrucomicrobiales bacterium]|nr:hypothetical protein [Verrucomicrobiales bacterium]
MRASCITVGLGVLMAAAGVGPGMEMGVKAAAPVGPSLTVARAGSGVRLVWDVQAGHRYRVEHAPGVTGAWQLAAELTVAVGNAEGSWTDTNSWAGVPVRLYRVADLGPAESGGLTFDSAARASDLVPVELSDLYTRSAQNAYDAIQVATSYAPAGSPPVTHGTLRLTGDPSNPVSYDALPGDHLVLVPLQGATVEVYVQELDLARGIAQWRQVSAGSELVFRTAPGAQATAVTVKGRYASANFPEVVFDVDLGASITGFNEVDSSGTHTLNDMTVTGSVAATGYRQTVQTRNRFEFISVRGATGRLQSASTSESWNNNTVVFAGDTYRWNNVKRQRSFRDGKESDIDTYWNAVGTVSRNGQPYGEYRKKLTPIGTSVIDLRFQVVLPDRVLDVEQWTVQVPGSRP